MKRKLPRTLRSMTGPQRNIVVGLLWGRISMFTKDDAAFYTGMQTLKDLFENKRIPDWVYTEMEFAKDLVQMTWGTKKVIPEGETIRKYIDLRSSKDADSPNEPKAQRPSIAR